MYRFFLDLCVYLASFKIHTIDMVDNNDLFWDLISWVTSEGTSFMLACALMTLLSQLKLQVRVEFSCADKIQSGLRFFHWWIPALLIFLTAVQQYFSLFSQLFQESETSSSNRGLLPPPKVEVGQTAGFDHSHHLWVQFNFCSTLREGLSLR